MAQGTDSMSDCFAELALPLDEPVRVELIRAGTNASRLNQHQWTRQPFAVVGFVRKGAFEAEVEGGPTWRVERGGAYLIPPDARFRTRMLGPDEGVYVWSHVNFYLAAGVELSSLLRLHQGIGPGHDGQTIERINEAFAGLIADRALAADSTNARATHTLRGAIQQQRLGMEMLEVLLDHVRPTEQAGLVLQAHGRLRPVLEYVQAHLDEPITRADLARVASLSESRLHVVFRKAMGVAPLVYVTQARLRQAQRLLMHSDQPIAQVGQACGYADAFHFSRQFKEHVGLSPRAYRQQQQRRWRAAP